MYNVLVFGVTENPGGVESVILNYYRCIDKTRFHFDFLCNFHEKAAYEDELIAAGGKVFHITARSDNYFRYQKEMKDFFQSVKGQYQAIWVNVCSLANIDYLIMAKKYGIPRRIIHSHNSQNMDSGLRGLLHARNRKKVSVYATDFWTCSTSAAEWFYEEKIFPEVVTIRNAISAERMAFDGQKRKEYRKKSGWDENFVIGNIGRLHFQKNQRFILEVFKYVLNKIPDARLVLIGQGEDEAMLKEYAGQLAVSDKVYFVGIQSDIAGWLSAMDFFLFPSKFEGLPIAALEAQANGLVTLASRGVIPDEVKVNDNFIFYNLDLDPEEWSNKIIDLKKSMARIDTVQVKHNFEVKGYDIETETAKLEALFLKGRV